MATLYVVPTPIGNIKDITLRAVEVLKSTRVILSEDTRITRKLLRLLEIDFFNKKFIKFFEHNETKVLPQVVEMIESGIDVAMVSDAGTPVLSDPGFKLIRQVYESSSDDADVVVLPGATSITTALIKSAYPPDRFTFLGYLPRKPSDRKKLFSTIKSFEKRMKVTYIAFESPHRIRRSLEAMKKYFGYSLRICLCQELTKKYERRTDGNLKEIIDMIDQDKINLKGELVIIFNLNL